MEVQVGKVTHYFNHLNVAVLKLTDALKVGDRIHVLGHATDFIQKIGSMEVDHQSVVWVKPGDDVALKVIEPVHEHDIIYLVAEEAFAL